MDCRAFERALAAGRPREISSSPAHAGHMTSCPSCRSLFEVVCGADAEPVVASKALTDAIAAQVTAGLQPVRPLPPRRFFVVVLAAAALVVTAAGLIYLRPRGIFLLSPVQAVLVLSSLAALIALAITTLTRQMVPGASHRIAPAVLFIGGPVLLLALFIPLFDTHAMAHFWRKSMVCLLASLEVAVPVGVAAFAVLRRGAVMRPRSAGAAAGLLAGLVGLLVLEVHCPLIERSHILVGHLGALLIAIAAGALLSPWTDRGSLRHSPAQK